MLTSFVLTLSCPVQHGANIEEAAQFNNQGTQLFFMRVRFACEAQAQQLEIVRA